jgi:hypothetical protein
MAERWVRKRTIDKEIRGIVDFINEYTGYETLGSCFGHGRYPITIVARKKGDCKAFELVSGEEIPRKRNFYRQDSLGYYYIPEVSEEVR